MHMIYFYFIEGDINWIIHIYNVNKRLGVKFKFYALCENKCTEYRKKEPLKKAQNNKLKLRLLSVNIFHLRAKNNISLRALNESLFRTD